MCYNNIKLCLLNVEMPKSGCFSVVLNRFGSGVKKFLDKQIICEFFALSDEKTSHFYAFCHFQFYAVKAKT